MALQGTLDTFELPDVLRLLASTAKTGRLRLESDRGDGDVWLANGQVVGVESPGGADDLGDALFELLRARDGAFAFEPGAEPASWRAAVDVEPLLADAEDRLVEWRSIEAVVPGIDAWVALAPELPGPEVTVDAETWRLVATIAGGLTVAELGDLLGLGEIAVCRLVRDVVELGLGVVSTPPAHAARPAEPEPEPLAIEAPGVPEVEAPAAFELDEHPADADDADAWVPSPTAFEVGHVDEADDAEGPAPAPAAVVDDETDEPDSPYEPFESYEAVPAAEVELLPAAEAVEHAAPVAEPVADADDVARQLSMLSPRAAQAVAAAAAATTDADRDAALDAVDGEEPINRGLLLKFLSSVKS